jgi:hypothetical protein
MQRSEFKNDHSSDYGGRSAPHSYAEASAIPSAARLRWTLAQPRARTNRLESNPQ